MRSTYNARIQNTRNERERERKREKICGSIKMIFLKNVLFFKEVQFF